MTSRTLTQQAASAKPAAPFSLPKNTFRLFLGFVLYLVVPIIEIPIGGLSLSAPVLFLVFLEIFLRQHSIKWNTYRGWIAIIYAFMLGLLLSLAANTFFRQAAIGNQDLLTLIRYSYWMLAFLTTMVIVSSTDCLKSIGLVIAIGILLLAGLRLYEAFSFGRWGAWTRPQFLTQNSYGIQFSTFFPFALMLPFVLSGGARTVAICALVFAFASIAGNGSRSSWIAVSAGIVVFLSLYSITQRKGTWQVQNRLIIVATLLIFLVALAPQTLIDPVTERFDTFNSLEDDKSYLIRQLMIQKGRLLFEENPLFGAGVGRFKQASVSLDIPARLRYAEQDYFDTRSSHNSYVALLGETGLAGMVPFVLLHLILVLKGFSAVVRLARRDEVWAIAVFSSYVGMSIHLWSFSSLTNTTTWVIYGLMAGMIERDVRSKQHNL